MHGDSFADPLSCASRSVDLSRQPIDPLVFESRSAIWVTDAGGSNLMELYSQPLKQSGTPRWSPDGEWIAFDCGRFASGWEVYVIRSGGGKPVLLTPGMAFAAIPTWSMDGKWVYFASTVSGQSQVWKTRSSGGDAVQVTRKGGRVAFESHDGKTLFYTKHDLGESGGLWRMPVGGGEEELVIPSVAGRNFAVANSGVYFIEATGEQAFIRFLLFATGKVKTVASIPSWGHGISVSPDERFLIYSRPDESPNGLMLVENFRP